MTSAVSEFSYKLPGTVSGSRPGAHASRNKGSGMAFASHARLFDVPDPRRLDFRASITDIRKDWLVRTYLQRSSTNINVVADVSASMHFGNPDKLHVVAEFLKALGNSAQSYGDTVCLLPYDRIFREDLYQPPRSGRAAGIAMSSAVSTLKNRAAAGQKQALIDTINRIDSTRGITFLISDFHWELGALEPLLSRFHSSLLVPIIVWSDAEIQPPSKDRWLPVRDIEIGGTKNLWLRKKTRLQWLTNVESRRKELTQLFSDYDIYPLFIAGQFNAEDITRYFMENVA